ncbi:amino acid transporter [Cryptococcus wingfieldii CBS 7118]|uniref:Amino acid transporter n=1 Tax=Cryptococcus wingfieldii CBS 7118 TaxID=1295528 RepID=A0A1E3JME1_9TREE|nr:amino acid transporter [Cryptococcus wingfieldii CBS 7118]ODO01826.1 amino acid transporter [Cryptococcus wingfieldii CBS 7118]
MGLLIYTLVVMCGGNPLHDAFGFRYWKDPGPLAGNTPTTRLQAFVNAVNVVGFSMGVPEYLSMIAGEAKDPRKVVPRAFKTLMWRLMIFFVGGGICVGILLPSNNTETSDGENYAGKSPYVISMQNLNIPILPSIVTGALIIVIISAGNAFTFNASRSLHALALDGKAPKVSRRLNKNGVPWVVAVCTVGGFDLFVVRSYLALGSNSKVVLNWILNFCTTAAMFNWCVMAFTWIRFDKAMKAQGVDCLALLPAPSKLQPYAGYWVFFRAFLFLWIQWIQGYSWDVATFIFNYGVIALAGGMKIFARTPFQKPLNVDLETDLDLFDALTDYYQQQKDEGPPATLKDRILEKLF